MKICLNKVIFKAWIKTFFAKNRARQKPFEKKNQNASILFWRNFSNNINTTFRLQIENREILEPTDSFYGISSVGPQNIYDVILY